MDQNSVEVSIKVCTDFYEPWIKKLYTHNVLYPQFYSVPALQFNTLGYFTI